MTLSWFFICDAQISKPSNPGRLGKGPREQDTHASHGEVFSAAHSSNKNNKKLSGQVQGLQTGPNSVYPFYMNLSQAGTISEWFQVSSVVQKQQGVRSSSSAEERGAACSADRPEEEGTASGSARGVSAGRTTAAGNLSDGSERDSGAQDSSNDADSEASESECAPQPLSLSHGHASTSSTSTLTPSPTPVSASSPTSTSRLRRGGSVEQLVAAVSKVNLNFSPGDGSTHYSLEEQGEAQTRENLHHQHHQGAFQSLSHSYIPSSKECSIQSCLHQFTSVELLMGNNKLLCENCTERRQKHLHKSTSAGESIYLSSWVPAHIDFRYLQCQNCTYSNDIVYFCCSCRQKGWKNVHQCQEANADILTAPSHHFTSETLPSGGNILPSFSSHPHQIWCCGEFIDILTHDTKAGMNFRKVNRHVDFPLILDMAPFCSALCKVLCCICISAEYTDSPFACLSVCLKMLLHSLCLAYLGFNQNLAAGERVLYSLYGIVEHSGSMRVGHYTAYVKVRPPQRKTEQHHKKLSGQGSAFLSTFCLICLFMKPDSVLQQTDILCSSSSFFP